MQLPIENPKDRIAEKARAFQGLAEKYTVTNPEKSKFYARLQEIGERYLADGDDSLHQQLEELGRRAQKQYGDPQPSYHVYINGGYDPHVEGGKYSIDIANARAFLGLQLENPNAGIRVSLQFDDTKGELTVSVHDNDGDTRPNIPVDLTTFRREQDDLDFVEKPTDQNGKAVFAVPDVVDLQYSHVGVGTFDGEHSIGQLSIAFEPDGKVLVGIETPEGWSPIEPTE